MVPACKQGLKAQNLPSLPILMAAIVPQYFNDKRLSEIAVQSELLPLIIVFLHIVLVSFLVVGAEVLEVEVRITARVEDELEPVSFEKVVGEIELIDPRTLLVGWEEGI